MSAHIDWLVAEKDLLIAVDGEDLSLFGYFLDRLCLRHRHLDAGLQTRGR